MNLLRDSHGMSLTGVLVLVAAIGAFGIASIKSAKSLKSVEMRRQLRGEATDVNSLVLNRLDCENTPIETLCAAGEFVAVKDENGDVVLEADGSAVYGQFAMRAQCTEDNKGLVFKYKRVDSEGNDMRDPMGQSTGDWLSISSVPTLCPKKPPPPFCMLAVKGTNLTSLPDIVIRHPSAGSGEGRSAPDYPMTSRTAPYGAANFFYTDMAWAESILGLKGVSYRDAQRSPGTSKFKSDFLIGAGAQAVSGVYAHVHGGGITEVVLVTSRRTFHLTGDYTIWVGHQDPFILTNGKKVIFGYKSLDFGTYYKEMELEEGEYPVELRSEAQVIDDAGSGGYTQYLVTSC